MPFYRSLICWLGCDNRQRYSLIVLFSHLFFMFVSLLFPTTTSIQFIALIVAVIITTCSTKRRLTDGKLTHHWLFAPGAALLLTGGLVIAIQAPAAYWLLVLSLSLATVLLTYPGKTRRHYIYGYTGPVDLTKQLTSYRQRIEPKLVSETHNFESVNTIEQSFQNNAKSDYSANELNSSDKADIGELIRNKLLNNKNATTTIAVIALLVISAIIITLFIPQGIDADSQATQATEMHRPPESEANARENYLAMPDDFSLYTTQYQGVIINWQADDTIKQELWNVRQARGDESCKQITFNSGESYRTTLVTVENQEDYYAEFSPLDTNVLVESLAKRSNFSLCGYSFSLKGSQAALGKHAFYGQQLVQ